MVFQKQVISIGYEKIEQKIGLKKLPAAIFGEMDGFSLLKP
jgi:hypothetical protein